MNIQTRVTPHKPRVPIRTLPEDERDIELYKRLHADMSAELKKGHEKARYNRKHELDKPSTWIQHLVLDDVWFRIPLFFLRKLS